MDTIAKLFGTKAPVQYASMQPAVAGVSNPKLLIGAELEIENLPLGLDAYRGLAGGAWGVVDDGSLRPRGEAWEFVSKPMALESLLAEMRALFDKLKLTEGNYSDRTSVHIHANVQDFTQEQLATLNLVYSCVEDVLLLFVNTYNVDMKKHPEGMWRDTNIYCVPWSQCRMNYRLVDRIIFNPGEAFKRWQKYSALNLLPVQTQGTVEWRHMHGTNDMDKLTKWVSTIGSIMQYAKETPFEDVVKIIKDLNNVSTYQQFFASVIGNNLVYSDEYREMLAEGCTNAKYSLSNWELNKKAGTKTAKVSARDRFLEDEIADVGGVVPEEPAAAPRGNWWDLNNAQVIREAGQIRVQEGPAQADIARRDPLQEFIQARGQARRNLLDPLRPARPALNPARRVRP